MAADRNHSQFVPRHENVVQTNQFVHNWDHHDWNHRDWNHNPAVYAPAYPGYGYAPQAVVPAVPGAPVYSAPYSGGYVAPYGGGYAAGRCGNLTKLEDVYRHDRNTGHPAAANDVVRRMQTAESRCGGVAMPLSNYAYGRNGSVFAPLLGNFLGIR